jgi:hypothetical protein
MIDDPITPKSDVLRLGAKLDPAPAVVRSSHEYGARIEALLTEIAALRDELALARAAPLNPPLCQVLDPAQCYLESLCTG